MTKPSASRFLKPETAAKDQPAPALADIEPANDEKAEDDADLNDLRVWG
jgi:hypothetical protein